MGKETQPRLVFFNLFDRVSLRGCGQLRDLKPVIKNSPSHMDIKSYVASERCFVYRPKSTVAHLLDGAMLTCLEQVYPACISGCRVVSDFALTDSLTTLVYVDNIGPSTICFVA